MSNDLSLVLEFERG